METNYSAKIIMGNGSNCARIDIQPPLGAISEDTLKDFGADHDTVVAHEITTAATTRFRVTISDESLHDRLAAEAFENTARYILATLREVDEGLDVGGRRPHTLITLSGKDLDT